MKNFIAFEGTRKKTVIDTDTIVRLQTAKQVCTMYLNCGKEIVLNKGLKLVMKQLDITTFVRVHQSHVVNVNHVSDVAKNKKGHCVITLTDSKVIPVARRRTRDLFDALHKHVRGENVEEKNAK